jgi:hypothetical protein
MPSGALTEDGRLFSTVGAKPGGSEAAEAFELSAKPRPKRVHSAIPAVLKTTTEIKNPAETDSGLAEGALSFECLLLGPLSALYILAPERSPVAGCSVAASSVYCGRQVSQSRIDEGIDGSQSAKR